MYPKSESDKHPLLITRNSQLGVQLLSPVEAVNVRDMPWHHATELEEMLLFGQQCLTRWHFAHQPFSRLAVSSSNKQDMP